jgi:hypothetical protein
MTILVGVVAAVLPLVPCWLALARGGVLGGASRLAAAYGFALGVTSAAFFVARTLNVPIAAYLWLEAGMSIAATVVLGWRAFERAGDRTGRTTDGAGPPRTMRWLVRVAVALSVTGIAAFARHELVSHPYGLNDTWAIWNVRAAFLASDAWRDAFIAGMPLPHQDYPLLLPGAVARLWSLVGLGPVPAGYLSVSVVIATALLVSDTAARRAGMPVMAASLGLLLTPEFVRQGATQHADLLVGFYTVLAVALVSSPSGAMPRWVAAGVASGCAAWSKNEGLVAALAFAAVALVAEWRSRGRASAINAASDLVIGAGPLLLLLALFKLLLAPPNDLVSGALLPGAYLRWTDSVRVSFVAMEMVRGIWQWGGWPWVPPVLAAAMVAAVPKTSLERSPGGAARLALVLLAVQLAVIFVVYVTTPHSVAWHLGTSWSRLVAQLWPTAVLCACTARLRRNP